MAESTVTDTTVSATAVVDATPAEVFAYVTRPANHREINGDGTVQDGSVKGPDALTAVGQKFSVAMKQFGLPYRLASTVLAFEQDRRIAWAHALRNRWIWEVEPTDDGRTRVTETFDLEPALLKPVLRRTLGVPASQERNVARSVDNVVGHFAKG